jgi:hypothetical protein
MDRSGSGAGEEVSCAALSQARLDNNAPRGCSKHPRDANHNSPRSGLNMADCKATSTERRVQLPNSLMLNHQIALDPKIMYRIPGSRIRFEESEVRSMWSISCAIQGRTPQSEPPIWAIAELFGLEPVRRKLSPQFFPADGKWHATHAVRWVRVRLDPSGC